MSGTGTNFAALIIGLVLTVSCGAGIYYILFELVFKGAFAAEWLRVIAGGFLIYLFGGLLVIGFIMGIWCIAFALVGDT